MITSTFEKSGYRPELELQNNKLMPEIEQEKRQYFIKDGLLSNIIDFVFIHDK